MEKERNDEMNKKISGNIEKYSDPDYFHLKNPKYFLTLNEGNLSNGIDIVENIVVLSEKYDKKEKNFKSSFKLFKEEKKLENSYIIQKNQEQLQYFTESSKNFDIINFMNNNLDLVKVTNNLEMIEDGKGFKDCKLDLNQIIIMNENISLKKLIKLYKIAIETKIKYFEHLKLPYHIQNVLNSEEFIIIACEAFNSENIDKKDNQGIISSNSAYDIEEIEEISEDFEKLEKELINIMIKSCNNFLKNLNLSFGILDYMIAEGITIDSLVDAGMKLCVDVEETDELRKKLKQQILKSLEDINVIALLMSAIRCEDDFQVKRLREVDVSDDPAYLYTDEVLGMAIANQISGTKAIFNFKRYDEAKPGIIAKLGPMVDDIFAGLVAGSMSKIFEDNY